MVAPEEAGSIPDPSTVLAAAADTAATAMADHHKDSAFATVVA